MAYRELLQVGQTYNVPIKTYTLTPDEGQTVAEALATLPVEVPAGSVCELITTNGLDVYMFCKTGEKQGTWVLI